MKKSTKEEIENLQNYDALNEAEKIKGNSYKEDNDTAFLGMFLQMEKTKKMNRLMKKTNDSSLSNNTENYINIVKDIGFQEIYSETFFSKSTEQDQKLYVFWHDEYSILLKFDTYKDKINGGDFYYNWLPKNMERNGATSSGGFIEGYVHYETLKEVEYPIKETRFNDVDVSWEEFLKISKKENELRKQWIKENNVSMVYEGSHDCRESIRFNINKLIENGKFLKNWKQVPFLWLLNHSETNKDSENYREINKEKIEKFPDYVKKCMSVKV